MVLYDTIDAYSFRHILAYREPAFEAWYMFPSDALLRTKLEGVLDLYELLGVLISSSVLCFVSIVFLSMLR